MKNKTTKKVPLGTLIAVRDAVASIGKARAAATAAGTPVRILGMTLFNLTRLERSCSDAFDAFDAARKSLIMEHGTREGDTYTVAPDSPAQKILVDKLQPLLAEEVDVMDVVFKLADLPLGEDVPDEIVNAIANLDALGFVTD